MASRRCPLCGINYPNVTMKFLRCPVHPEQETQYNALEPPDANWEWRASVILARTGSALEEEELRPLVLEVRLDDEGFYWIKSADVIRGGVLHRLPPDEVIRIIDEDAPPAGPGHPANDLWEVQMYRDSTREYWIRPLRVPDHPPVEETDA